ncbi:MAG TPA: S9 family peptidase, partial [bacterium]|nr:S9 family peptidase [bacterium]
MTIDDLLALTWVDDPQVSPDGRRVVWVQKTVDREADTYRSHLWMMDLDSGGMRQFTWGAHQDSLPRWSPDGRALAFLSDRGSAGAAPGAKRPKQIYVIAADGGEARALTSGMYAVTDLAWSPDGRTIAFIGKPPQDTPLQGEAATDVKVITRVRYKFDGEGFWDGRYKHLFTVPAEGGEIRQVTAGDFDHVDPAWSPDGRWIAVVANRSDDADYTNVTDVWLVPAEGGPMRRLTASLGPCGQPAWSPDGRRIAYLGHDNAAMSATNTGLWVVGIDGGAAVRLAPEFDRSLTHHIITDMRAHPKVGAPRWAPDGRTVLVLVAEGATTQLAAIDVGTGTVTTLTTGRREIYGASFDRNLRRGVIAVSDPLTPGDLWALEFEGGALRERRLTAVNAARLEAVELSVPERFTYEGADGWPVEGWVMRPVGWRPGERYPTVLQIHGGPHGAYGEAFFHEFQVLAGAGFAVVYTNPRGSQGYGQRFTAATHHDWGGKDYEDIMRGVDAALERFAFLDPDRLGVAGGSYGGFMTNWVIGHTDRFKAAVTMRSISNHLSQWGTSDLAFMKGFWEFPGDPWESPMWYWERSPLAYVANIKTPLLILHSEMDLRCPIPEAEQLFAALKKLRREVVFVRFPNESHDLSRIGKPAHRLERLRHIVRWFADHLRQDVPS